jgi:hypothetical protein
MIVIGNSKYLYICLKDTNSRLIDYAKSINKKVGTTNSGKEFSEITENNKSRKIKEFKSKAETALWVVIISLSRPTYAPGIFPGILSK